ncbi:MAG TPA: hypothetical protein VF278_06275 [Pirellulales bacterium]
MKSLIAGHITQEGIPAIDIQIGNQAWRAIIDTGFNGDLELPEPLRSYVNARFVGRVGSLLAANQRIEEDVFLVDFPFDSRTVRAQATFTEENDILIGTGMLRDYRLMVDFRKNIVVIDKP